MFAFQCKNVSVQCFRHKTPGKIPPSHPIFQKQCACQQLFNGGLYIYWGLGVRFKLEPLPALELLQLLQPLTTLK